MWVTPLDNSPARDEMTPRVAPISRPSADVLEGLPKYWRKSS